MIEKVEAQYESARSRMADQVSMLEKIWEGLTSVQGREIGKGRVLRAMKKADWNPSCLLVRDVQPDSPDYKSIARIQPVPGLKEGVRISLKETLGHSALRGQMRRLVDKAGEENARRIDQSVDIDVFDAEVAKSYIATYLGTYLAVREEQLRVSS